MTVLRRYFGRAYRQTAQLSENSEMEEWRYTGRNVLHAHVSAYSGEVKWEKGMNANISP